MRKKFPEFYTPNENDFQRLWKQSLFVFDANTLLNLYMYTEDTVNDFWKVFENIKGRIWISFQAGYEFHKNRASRIRTQQVLFEKTISSIKNISDDAKTALVQNFKNTREHPSIQENEILKEVSDFFESLVIKVEKKKKDYPDLFKEEDEILSKISDLFDGKVGNKFSEEKLEEIFKEGEERYKREIPPGFEDAKDKEGNRKFGDLVIWKEILEYAKDDKVRSVIFITDDGKKDWWKIASGRTISPHPKLIKEFKDETDKEYYQYSSEQFLRFAQSNLIEVSDESIIETKRVAETNNPNRVTFKLRQDQLNRIKEMTNVNPFSGLTQDQIDEITGQKRLRELAEVISFNQRNLFGGLTQDQIDEITGRKRLKELAQSLTLNQSLFNFSNKPKKEDSDDSSSDQEE